MYQIFQYFCWVNIVLLPLEVQFSHIDCLFFVYCSYFSIMKGVGMFKFEIFERKYKITYLLSEPISVYISTRLIGFNTINKTIRFDFTGKGIWFVPNLDYGGCSFISIKDTKTKEVFLEKLIDKSLSNIVKGQNIICIGLNKTGTSSFTSAMETLGYKRYKELNLFHFVTPDVYHGNFTTMFAALNNPQYNLFNDTPFSFPDLYKKIYSNRPNDIYILTIRSSVEKWIRSVMNYYEVIRDPELNNDNNSFLHTHFSDKSERLFLNFLLPLFDSWGIRNTDNLESNLKKVYETHYNDCVEFFKDKPNFRIVEIEKKGELKKITNWLGIKNEELDFPWENKNQ